MGANMRIETPRLILRPWRMTDAAFVGGIMADPEVMEFSDHGALAPEQYADWLRSAMAAELHFGLPECFAIEDQCSQKVIGYIRHGHDPKRVAPGSAELGFRLVASAWGQGFAVEAGQAVIAASQVAGLAARVVAIVDPNHLRSVRVLQKLGLRYDRDIMLPGYDYPDHLYQRDFRR